MATRPGSTDGRTTRPPEPLRPPPAVRPGLSLLATRVRRHRFQAHDRR
ncbi:MAG: hypothetical protein JWN67_1922 [Actinomycetia bacterium]|nr:hypothetical protein [Actinomycetes bacterium]